MRKVTLIAGSILVLIALIILSTVMTRAPVVLAPLDTTPHQGSATPNGFIMLPPGSVLPSERECSVQINRSASEPRADNATANRTIPTHQQIARLIPWGATIGADAKADLLRKQITGNFTGTTGEILQWVACKWGIAEDIVLAEAVVESNWHQNFLGDYTHDRSRCPPRQWDSSGCYQSYGILQLTYTYFPSTWPMSRDDTAFSAEYVYGVIRTCYEGWTTYLADKTPLSSYPTYRAGDIWGCLGMWYSGSWYDRGAIDYINKVKAVLNNKDWLQPRF